MKNKDLELKGLEIMGDNLRNKVKFCGEGVRLYPLCKIIHKPSYQNLNLKLSYLWIKVLSIYFLY